MDDIKYIITVITVSFIIYGLLLVFTPTGNMGKHFKTTVGIALIAVIVLTVARQHITVEFDDIFKTEDITLDSTAVTDLTVAVTKDSLEDYINDVLISNGCIYEDLEVFTNISADGGISIDRVEISCKPDYSEKIKDIINSMSVHCVVSEK